MLRLTGQAVALTALGAGCSTPRNRKKSGPSGRVTGDLVGDPVGERILAEGGNAVDAAVAAALVACVTSPHRSGIGGYGGHMTLALAGGKKIASIDFNSAAPAAAREDMFALNDKGGVVDAAHMYGWLAVGVPGTMAGLQLALDRYGTKSFRELAQPAIRFARDGYIMPSGQATTIRGAAARLKNDPGSARLYFENGEPLKAGVPARNPDLAALLTTLADNNSADAFYRGDIGQRIAAGIRKNGGLVTAADMAAYHAREVQPLRLKWNEFDVFTAPLTAGGLTVLEALTFLRALSWDKAAAGPRATHARLEALRVAWKDRLELLGDPEHSPVPVERLLSVDYANETAEKIQAAVRAQQPLPQQIKTNSADGTTHISAADSAGNLVAITFTQGGSFGAQVTVDGLGLTLGHGMSRFNPRPGQPNSPGPRKRPLHNMCPTVVLRDGQPVMAVGGRGGVRIPNTIFEVLTKFVVQGGSMEAAIAAPRIHCMGDTALTLEQSWPAADREYLQRMGFQVKTGPGAYADAVSFNPKTGECRAMGR